MEPRRIIIIVAGLGLWITSASAASAAEPSTQELIDRAVAGGDDLTRHRAWKSVHDRMQKADETELSSTRYLLLDVLTRSDDAEIVRRVGLLVSTRPDSHAVSVMLERLNGASAGRMQQVLCEALRKSLGRLAPHERRTFSGEVALRMTQIVAQQPSLTADAAVWCLGALRSDGLAALKSILNQDALRRKVADSLPTALAETGDPGALQCLVELSDRCAHHERKTCVWAMGVLLGALKKAGADVPQQAQALAMERIHAGLRLEGDAKMLAASMSAGAMAVGVDNDEILRQTVIGAISHPDAHVRVAAMQALFGTQTSRLESVRQQVRLLRQTEESHLTRATAMAVLDAIEAEED
jgi:hypothetical protein